MDALPDRRPEIVTSRFCWPVRRRPVESVDSPRRPGARRQPASIRRFSSPRPRRSGRRPRLLVGQSGAAPLLGRRIRDSAMTGRRHGRRVRCRRPLPGRDRGPGQHLPVAARLERPARRRAAANRLGRRGPRPAAGSNSRPRRRSTTVALAEAGRDADRRSQALARPVDDDPRPAALYCWRVIEHRPSS